MEYKSSVDEVEARLQEAKEANERRAARFGVPIIPVREQDVLGVRRYMTHVNSNFKTGFDITSSDERLKAAARQERFQSTNNIGYQQETNQEQQPLIPVKTLEPRRNASSHEEDLRTGVIHVYGVDTLSTKNIKDIFIAYYPQWVEWINDSSCNVAFDDEFTPRRILLEMGKYQEVLSENGETIWELIDKVSPNVLETEEELFRWRRTDSAKVREGLDVVLFVRNATMCDVRPEKPNPKSNWSRSIHRMDVMDTSTSKKFFKNDLRSTITKHKHKK
uniref:Nuclear cap-binding protein subunit 3 n=1 Tax=Timspurckia oligopyrenoides TaxID=708627 RepID=A0A7S1ETS2_9RHOD|mmetsp:Transcript_670/g.1206  ORF Transcript_670/g.1206 Transcript_670/m.1206 type:complete len:276 (+) Transcript_670:43-870(+)